MQVRQRLFLDNFLLSFFWEIRGQLRKLIAAEFRDLTDTVPTFCQLSQKLEPSNFLLTI